jgi:RNA polymerase sigma factor (sigma-70 family)
LVQVRQAAGQTVVPAAGISAEPSAPEGFEDFFRDAWRPLVKRAMIVGANQDEAEQAAQQTLVEMLRKWPVEPYPLAYARKAVVNNFIKAKKRGTLDVRVAQRLIARGNVPHQEGAEDSQLTASEDDEWMACVFSLLPPAQRKVMELIAEGYTRKEIQAELGKSPDAVRRSICDACTRLRQLLHPDGEFIQPGRTTPRSRAEAR